MKRWLILIFPLLVNSAYAMTNPASVYCLRHGGELKIMKGAAGGAVGICVFHNKSYCEELTEGKFSYPINHSILKTLKDTRLFSILQKRKDGK